jgi:hypothetical protein
MGWHTRKMKSEIVKIKRTKKYDYYNIVIFDKDIIDCELVKKWNSGVDVVKHGAWIKIKIRKAI